MIGLLMNVEQLVECELAKSAPMPLWPTQTPHDLTWDRMRVAAMGSFNSVSYITLCNIDVKYFCYFII
jgi:hypothetical protein